MFAKATIFLFFLAVSTISALPQRPALGGFFAPAWTIPSDFQDGSDSYEEETGGFDYPEYSHMSSLLRGMQDMMYRMRQQLADAMKRFPTHPQPPSPSDFGIAQPTNSSSTTTIVGGHVVTVNESTYSSGDGSTSAVFRIKVVDIKPHHGEETEKEANVPVASEPPTVVSLPPAPSTSTPVDKAIQTEDQSPESLETVDETPTKTEDASTELPIEVTNIEGTSPSVTSSEDASLFDNEIPKTRDGRLLQTYGEREWLQDSPIHEKKSASLKVPPSSSSSWTDNWSLNWPLAYPKSVYKWRRLGQSNNERLYPRGYEPERDAEIIPGVEKPIDLGSDLRVNELLSERAEAGGLVMPDPDSEFVELQNGKIVPSFQKA